MNKLRTIAIICICVFFFTTGCGYSTASLVYPGAKSVHVSNFANKINVTEEVTDKRMYVGYKSGMELDVTREVIDRFIIDGNLKVASRKNADLILIGEVIDFKKEALRYDSADNVEEFRNKVIVNIKLLKAKSGDVILEENNFTGESTYRTTGEFAKSEDSAIRETIKDLAVRIVERIVEGW